MPKLQFKLCDEDRALYGGEEWETFDRDRFEGTRAGELELYERQTGVSLQVLLNTLNGELTAVGVRALIWIARYQRGLRTPFGDFDIKTVKVTSKYVPDDEPPREAPPLDSSPGGSETSP